VSEGILIAPSILSADFTHLAEEIAEVEAAGADWLHIDVMDGHYVPNLTIGPPVVKALKRIAKRPLDVHLMIENTDDTLAWYLDAGADSVTVHAESTTHIHRAVQAIKAAGAKAGASVNPGTPVSALRDVLPELDLVLVMSVNPGFGGQAFIDGAIAKIAELAEMCEDAGVTPIIQVDGGINAETVVPCVEAGARCFVAGNAVFGEVDRAAALSAIRRAGEAAL
jgi:ribulose-phosphate 3-epimerase